MGSGTREPETFKRVQGGQAFHGVSKEHTVHAEFVELDTTQTRRSRIHIERSAPHCANLAMVEQTTRRFTEPLQS